VTDSQLSTRPTRIAAILTVVIGCTALLGWYFNLHALGRIFPEFRPMSPNTAFGLIVAGAALLLICRGTRRVVHLFGLVLIALAGLTLLQTVFGVNFGIDGMLVPSALPQSASVTRMSISSSINFIAFGITLLVDYRRFLLFTRSALMLIAVTSGIALVGLLYNAESLYDVLLYDRLALTSTLGFIMVSGGYLLILPSPLLTVITSQTSAGKTGRLLLPLALIVPVLLGWLVLQLIAAGAFDAVVGVTLLVLFTVVIFVVAISVNMRVVYKEEKLRAEAEKSALALTLQRERTRLVNDFVTNTLHDLRTPLSSIGTNAYIIQRTDDPAKRAERVKNIQELVARIARLLDQFAEMVRLNRMEGVLLNPLDLNLLVQRVIEEQSRLAQRHGLRFQLELAADLPPLAGAETLLRTALVQIINNAIRYTPQGGQITVRTRRIGLNVLLEVVDTGVGIPTESVQKVFEPQFKVDSSRGGDGSTGGFGLSMVKRIAELHRGRVEIESTVNRGTTVRLHLPLDAGGIQ